MSDSMSGCAGTTTSTTESPATETAAGTTESESTDESTATTSSGGNDVATQFERRLSRLDSYTATKTTRVILDGNETTTTARIWARPATGELRQVALDSSYGRNGTVTLRNESAIVIYQPDTDEIRRIEVTSTGSMNVTSVDTYENVQLNPEIPDARFRLDAPAEASVSEYRTPETRVYDSGSGLRENVSVSLPDPDPPADFTFQRARVTRAGVTSVSLQYRSGSDLFSVRTTNETTYDGAEDSGTVDIGNRTAAINEFNDAAILRWSCDGQTYSISGSVNESTIIDVAATIECP